MNKITFNLIVLYFKYKMLNRTNQNWDPNYSDEETQPSPKIETTNTKLPTIAINKQQESHKYRVLQLQQSVEPYHRVDTALSLLRAFDSNFPSENYKIQSTVYTFVDIGIKSMLNKELYGYITACRSLLIHFSPIEMPIVILFMLLQYIKYNGSTFGRIGAVITFVSILTLLGRFSCLVIKTVLYIISGNF